MNFFKILPLFALIIFSTKAIAGEHNAPDSVAGTENVTHTEAKTLHDQGVVFLDVRG